MIRKGRPRGKRAGPKFLIAKFSEGKANGHGEEGKVTTVGRRDTGVVEGMLGWGGGNPKDEIA